MPSDTPATLRRVSWVQPALVGAKPAIVAWCSFCFLEKDFSGHCLHCGFMVAAITCSGKVFPVLQRCFFYNSSSYFLSSHHSSNKCVPCILKWDKGPILHNMSSMSNSFRFPCGEFYNFITLHAIRIAPYGCEFAWYLSLAHRHKLNK